MLLKIVNKALTRTEADYLCRENFVLTPFMSEYEKILQKRLKRDAIVGIGIISFLVIIYFASMTLL
jgi:hypothetical protein